MPDQALALEKYRRGVATYDERNRFARLRARLVGKLGLRPADAVLDVACGTGLNFPLIEAAIGERGRLYGIDLSPDMLAAARARIAANGWRNVALIQSCVEDARVPEPVDAVVFCLTHDVMRSPAALANAMAHVKPGGRVAAAGSKWAPWWLWPINVAIWYGARRYTTTFEGFSRPWSHLAAHVADLQVEPHLYGAMYVAWGHRS